MEKLIITKFKDGAIVNASKTEGVVFLRVTTGDKPDFTDSGILMETKGKSATARMQVTMYEKYKAALAEGCDLNELFVSLGIAPKKIIKVETLTPQYDGHEAKKNPSNNTICVNSLGQPIYYNTKIVNLDVEDVIIPTGVAVAASAEALAQ